MAENDPAKTRLVGQLAKAMTFVSPFMYHWWRPLNVATSAILLQSADNKFYQILTAASCAPHVQGNLHSYSYLA